MAKNSHKTRKITKTLQSTNSIQLSSTDSQSESDDELTEISVESDDSKSDAS